MPMVSTGMRASRRLTARLTTRRGFTLVELLVALTLLGVVVAATVDVLVRQWRIQAALDARRAARAQLTAAADALRPTLRMAAGDADGPDPADLLAASDTLLEIRATIGAAVVCAVVDPLTVDLAPPSVVAPSLTWWRSAPQPGDVALLHDDSALGGSAWVARDLAAVGASTASCAGSPLVRAAEASLMRPRLRLAAPLPSSIVAGAPVHLVRRVRWVHYRAADGHWYLGEREWDGAAWTGTQPVAGPLRPPGPRGGLTVVARDSAGDPVPDASLATRRVVRVDLVLRADVPPLTGARSATTIDSVALVVAPRNGG
jgi:prepilin-type N-terminal cleavage/methylation domain-containing protein